jgi:hypothetical protein
MEPELKLKEIKGIKVCQCGACGTNFIVEKSGKTTIIEKGKGFITQEDYTKNPKLKRLNR